MKPETPATSSLSQYIRSLVRNGRSPNTVRAYQADIVGLIDQVTGQLGKIPTTEEVLDRAADYVNDHRHEWAPSTVGRKVGAIRSYSKFCELPALTHYSVPTPAKAVAHPIPEGIEGVIKMIEATSDYRKVALFALCGLAGLRISEARTLAAADIGPTDMLINVRGKGDQTRVVPLTDSCFYYIMPAWAEAMATGAPIVPLADRSARSAVTSAGRRAGLRRSIS